MSGIGTEIRVFCYAILTGVLIVAVYLWIRLCADWLLAIDRG